MVVVHFVVIRKWFEVLQRRMMWHGNTEMELCWWRVRSWADIGMVHWHRRNDSRVADEGYIKRGCSMLEDFLVFSLYLFSCITQQVWLWNNFDFGLVLIFSIRTSTRLVLITISYYCYQYHLRQTPPVTARLWDLDSENWSQLGVFLRGALSFVSFLTQLQCLL